MNVGIADIQQLPDDKIEITFCTYPQCEDYMRLVIDHRTAWEIAEFCRDTLSLRAQEIRAKKNLRQ